MKSDPSCLTVVREIAHGLGCSFISLIKSEKRRKGKVGQKLLDAMRIKILTHYCLWKTSRNLLASLRDTERLDQYPQMQKLFIMWMKSCEGLGMNASSSRIPKGGMPLFTSKGGELKLDQCAFMMGPTTVFKSSS